MLTRWSGEKDCNNNLKNGAMTLTSLFGVVHQKLLKDDIERHLLKPIISLKFWRKNLAHSLKYPLMFRGFNNPHIEHML